MSPKLSIEVVPQCSVSVFEDICKGIDVTWSYGMCSDKWLGNWLRIAQTKPELFILLENNKPVGFCFFTVKNVRKYGLSWKAAYLNQSGDTNVDQIWVENNRFFCAEQHESNFLNLVSEILFTKYSVSELVISLTDQRLTFNHISNNSTLYSSDCNVSYVKTLSRLCNIDDILLTLSKNSRSQLRRSIKRLKENVGEIELSSPQTKADQNSFFDHMSSFHIARWGNTNEGSGFNNEKFVYFHRMMLAQPETSVIVKLHASNVVLGYAYFITQNNTAYFYCSAITPSPEFTYFKVGHILHLYCMHYFASLGYLTYDFLAGDFRYKQSFSDTNYSMYTHKLVKKKSVLSYLARIKTLISRLLSTPSPDSPQQ